MGRRPAERPIANLFLMLWLPAILYVGVIFLVSAQPYLKPPFAFAFADKVAHILEYFGLGVLLARAVGASGPWKKPITVGLIALCLGIVVGTCDELFQSTVPGRESSGLDLAADTLGLAIAQAAYRAFARG
jgi:VanZ family protein